jgi:hypothetical protein
MTDLTKRVKRRTIAPHRGRRIVVSLLPGDVLSFREERTRKDYLLSIAGAFDYAVMLEVERRKREKTLARKGRK